MTSDVHYTVYVCILHMYTEVYFTKMAYYICILLHISCVCIHVCIDQLYIHVPLPPPPYTQSRQPMACMRGCSIGSRIFELETGNIYEHMHNWIFIL